MIAALSAAWTWFVGTKIGRWLVGVTLVIAGLLAALAVAFVKGERSQSAKDAARDAQANQRAAQGAADVQKQASDAVQAVQQAAVKQPPPDPVKRDDFNTSF